MSYREVNCSCEGLAASEVIFCTPPTERRRFMRRSWGEIVLPEDLVARNDFTDVFKALSSSFRLSPSSEVFVKTIYSTQSEYPACFVADFSEEDFDELWRYEGLSLGDYIVFDGDLRWGIYSSGQGFTAVGGEMVLINDLARGLGGADKVLSEFKESISCKGVDSALGQILMDSANWPC